MLQSKISIEMHKRHNNPCDNEQRGKKDAEFPKIEYS